MGLVAAHSSSHAQEVGDTGTLGGLRGNNPELREVPAKCGVGGSGGVVKKREQ